MEQKRYYITYHVGLDQTGLRLESYYILARSRDDAYLYANPSLEMVFSYCFTCGISRDEVVIV